MLPAISIPQHQECIIAMFYAVEATLITKNIISKSYSGIIALFGEYFIRTKVFPKEMGRHLNKAFEKRQIGDYGLRINIEKEVAGELLNNGEKNIIFNSIT